MSKNEEIEENQGKTEILNPQKDEQDEQIESGNQ